MNKANQVKDIESTTDINILDIGNNKTKCQHFTPNTIVESMLDLAEYRDNIIGKAVLENSFGSGNILKCIVKRYIEHCLHKKIDVNKIAQYLERDIYGVELDTCLYKDCIVELNQITTQYNIPNVKWQLFNENALSHKYTRKFDLIIGNPPYISYKELDECSRSFIKEKFEVCKTGKPDYCYAFIELGIKLLNEDGKLIQLIPNNIFKNVFAQKLRTLLKPHIKEIRDYPNQKLFEKALTSISIFSYDKTYLDETIKYVNITDNIELQINRNNLGDKWTFCNPTESMNKIRFGDIFNASVTIATLCNKAFVIDTNDFDIIDVEKEVLRTAVSPKSLRYNKNKKIIFPYYYSNGKLMRCNNFEKHYPKATDYLRQYKQQLENRQKDKNAKWYEYGRSQALAHLDNPKLLVSTIITNAVETYQIDKNTIPYSGIYITVVDNNYNLTDAENILKSQAFLQYVRAIGINVNGKSIRITCKDINNYHFSKEG